MEKEQVFMKFNRPGAQWEPVQFSKAQAIIALGGSYDLRFVDAEGKETIRMKVPKIPARSAIPTFTADTAFEQWLAQIGAELEPEARELVQGAFIAGFNTRHNR